MISKSDEIYSSHIKAIKEALEEGRLAIIAGAGVSRSENSDYPLWNDICNDLRKELCNIEEFDSLKLAQRYEIEFGRERLMSKIRNQFNKNGNTDLFEKILNLNPHCIITTNWDNLFNLAAEKNPSFWNVIANDEELVGLHNEQKIIKMHGDFIHSNIVFTENDYLNYEDSFPLISAYIKAILSTHVVLFLGYSFNDPDLKQILNWINKKSVNLPAKYFVNYQKNDKTDYSLSSWEKYLESWKLIVLPLESKKNETLSNLIDNISNGDTFPNDEKPINIFFNICKKLDYSDTIFFDTLHEYFYSVAKIQTEVLSTPKGFFLVFRISKDAKNIDNFKELFKSIELFSKKALKKNDVNKDDYKKIEKIYETLLKININGITLSSSTSWKNDLEIYFDENSINEEFLTFDYINLSEPKEIDDVKKYLRYVYNLIQIGNFYDAKKFCEKAIKICSLRKKFRALFICYFNMNYIIQKYNLPSLHKIEKSENQKISIEKELLKYPISVRNHLGELYDFFTFKLLYQKSLKMYALKRKVINSFDKKTGQQISFISNLENYIYEWKNFISYINSNCLYVEKHPAFIQIAKDYFYISLFLAKKQFDYEIKLLNIDLFTAVKYITPKNLLFIFSEVFRENSEKWTLKLSENLNGWFIDEVFEKSLENAFNHKYRRNEFLFDYVSNSLIILGHMQLAEDLKKQIINSLLEYTQNKHSTLPINFVEGLSYFLGARYENFGSNDIAKTDLERLLNSFIDRIAYVKVSYGELYSYTDNGLLNVFSYINATSEKYSNEKEIQKLMSSLILYDEPNRIALLQSVILYLFLISDEKCQNLIKKYASDKDNFSISTLNENLRDDDLQKLIICILNYHITNIKPLSEDDEKFIKNYLKENRSNQEKSVYLRNFYLQLCDIPEKKDTENKVIELLKNYFGGEQNK